MWTGIEATQMQNQMFNTWSSAPVVLIPRKHHLRVLAFIVGLGDPRHELKGTRSGRIFQTGTRHLFFQMRPTRTEITWIARIVQIGMRIEALGKGIR